MDIFNHKFKYTLNLHYIEIPKSDESITEIADKTEEIVEGLEVSLSEKRVPEISGVITIDTVEDETHIETEVASHTLVTQKTVETISQEIILQEESSEIPSDATFNTALTETVEITVKGSHETVTLVQEKPAEEEETPVSPQREVAPDITVESEEYQLVEQETLIVPEQVDQVEDKPEGIAPIFVQELQYIEAVEGKPVQFRCVVSGHPTPEITWLLDGEPIEDAKFEKLTESDGTCILRIPETYPHDEGEYECSAINDFGSASTKADLYIQVPAEQTDVTFNEIIIQESSASQNIFTTETEKLVLSASVEHAEILVSEEILSEKEKLVTAEEEKEDVSDEEIVHFEAAKEDEAEVRTVPVIQQHLAAIHTKDGGQAMFECVVSGIPKPEIEWYKDSEVLCSSEEFQIQYDENNLCSLFIGDVLPEDAGQYTIVARNEMGETSTTAQLFVEAAEDYIGGEPTESVEGIAPTFIQKPSYQKVDEGKNVSFECQIIAKPQPEIYWTKDGSDVPEDERINITLDTEGDTYHASLDIAESSPKDAGTYTITAANPQGQESVSVSLIVNKVLEEKTDFRDQLSTTVEEKDKDKPTELEQVDFRETLTTEVKTKVNVHFETEQLDFRHLLRKGNTISKKFESDVSTEETITVQEPVKATDVPQSIEEVFEVQQPKIISPKFDLVIDDLQVKEGESAKLICRAHGVPTPTITWYHATEELHTDDVYEITTGEEGESTLHIPEVLNEDAGLYTAKASNEAGQIECTSTISVEEVPSDHEDTFKDVKEVPIETTEEEEAAKAAIKIQAAFRGYQAREQVKVLREQSLVEDVTLQPEDSTDFVIQQLVDESTMQEFQHLHADPNLDEVEVGMKVYTWRMSKADRNSPLPGPTLFTEEFVVSDSYFPHQMKLEDSQEEQDVSYEFSMKQQSITLDEATVDVDTKAEILLTQPAPEEPQETQDVEGEFTLDYQEQVEDVSVDVTMAPVFLEVLEDQEVTEGTTVILTATVSGKPAPEVSWIKEGEDACIKPDDPYEITKDTEGHFTLIIHEATLDDDAQFTCTATNIAGTATISADLYVQPGGEAPTFIKCVEDVTVEYNAPIVLEVEVKGQPKPELTWTIDNEEIPSNRYRLEPVKDVVRLIIDKSELDDEGEYTVKATNSKGVATCHAEVKLRINGPQFDKPLENVSTRLKDTAQLQCDVTGIPFPEITWFVDGEPITKGPKYNYSCEDRHCVLTINDVSTEDVNKKYTCKAENVVGDASTSATLTVEGLLYF